MARIDTIRVTKQADVDVELAKRSRNKQLREAVSMSERHAPLASQGDAHDPRSRSAIGAEALPMQPPSISHAAVRISEYMCLPHGHLTSAPL